MTMKKLTEFIRESIDPNDSAQSSKYFKAIEDYAKKLNSMVPGVTVRTSKGGGWKVVQVEIPMDGKQISDLREMEDIFKSHFEKMVDSACSKLGQDPSEYVYPNGDCNYTQIWDNYSKSRNGVVFECTYDEDSFGDFSMNVPCIAGLLAGAIAVSNISAKDLVEVEKEIDAMTDSISRI